MTYLDTDTVLMSKPFHDFCDSIRKSEESKGKFWKQIDPSFLLQIPDSRMKFIPDRCPEFAECTVAWKRKGDFVCHCELISHIEALDSLLGEKDEENALFLAQIREMGITSTVVSQDIDLSGERPIAVPGTTVFKYLPKPKNKLAWEVMHVLETGATEAVAKKEKETGRPNGIEFDVIIGFIVVHFLLKYGPDNLDVEERTIEKEPLHPKQVKRASKTPILRTYKTYRVVNSFDFTDRNPIIRQCKLWLVRGHDRHYKGGKVVHIDPYYKGVDRDKVDKDNPPPMGRFIKAKPLNLDP